MPVLGDDLSFESEAVDAFEDLRASKLSWVSWTFHNTMQRGKLMSTGQRIHEGEHPYRRLFEIRRKRNTKVITREKMAQMKKEAQLELERRITLAKVKVNMIGRPLPRKDPRRSTLAGYDGAAAAAAASSSSQSPGSRQGSILGSQAGDVSKGGGGSIDILTKSDSINSDFSDYSDDEDNQTEGSRNHTSRTDGQMDLDDDEVPPLTLENMSTSMRFFLGSFLYPEDLLVMGMTSSSWYELSISEYIWSMMAINIGALSLIDQRSLHRQKRACYNGTHRKYEKVTRVDNIANRGHGTDDGRSYDLSHHRNSVKLPASLMNHLTISSQPYALSEGTGSILEPENSIPVAGYKSYSNEEQPMCSYIKEGEEENDIRSLNSGKVKKTKNKRKSSFVDGTGVSHSLDKGATEGGIETLLADGRSWGSACLLASSWRDMTTNLMSASSRGGEKDSMKMKEGLGSGSVSKNKQRGVGSKPCFAIIDLSKCPGLIDADEANSTSEFMKNYQVPSGLPSSSSSFSAGGGNTWNRHGGTVLEPQQQHLLSLESGSSSSLATSSAMTLVHRDRDNVESKSLVAPLVPVSRGEYVGGEVEFDQEAGGGGGASISVVSDNSDAYDKMMHREEVEYSKEKTVSKLYGLGKSYQILPARRGGPRSNGSNGSGLTSSGKQEQQFWEPGLFLPSLSIRNEKIWKQEIKEIVTQKFIEKKRFDLKREREMRRKNGEPEKLDENMIELVLGDRCYQIPKTRNALNKSQLIAKQKKMSKQSQISKKQTKGGKAVTKYEEKTAKKRENLSSVSEDDSNIDDSEDDDNDADDSHEDDDVLLVDVDETEIDMEVERLLKIKKLETVKEPCVLVFWDPVDVSISVRAPQFLHLSRIQRDWESTNRRLLNGLGVTAVDSTGGTYGRLIDSGIKLKMPKYTQNRGGGGGSSSMSGIGGGSSVSVSANSCNSSQSDSSLGGGKYSSHYHSSQGKESNYSQYKADKEAKENALSNGSGNSASKYDDYRRGLADKDGIRGGGWFQNVTHVLHARKAEDLDFSRVVCWLSTGFGLQGTAAVKQKDVWDFHLMKSPEFQQAINEVFDENKMF